MLKRRAGLSACLFAALLLAPIAARAESRQQILGLALGDSAPAPAQASVGFAAGDLSAMVIEGPTLVENPSPHYVLKLTRNRTLTIWFDAAKHSRPIYWIELNERYDPPAIPAPSYEAIREDTGRIDFKIPGTMGAPMGVLLIAIDPVLPEERALAARHHIETVVRARPEGPADDDLFVEPGRGIEYRFKLLGDAFRGRITSVFIHSNQIDGRHAELIDLTVAREALEAVQ